MAFHWLTSKTTIQPGEWVLVMGAAGALGSCCVQVAKMRGAKVIAAAGADDRVALAMEYGADFGVNYRKQDLAKEVMKLTDNDGVDVVCENIADPALWPGAFHGLAIGGSLVEKALEAARSGKIRAMNYRTMALHAAAEAHRLVEQNQLAGKLILDPTLD